MNSFSLKNTNPKQLFLFFGPLKEEGTSLNLFCAHTGIILPAYTRHNRASFPNMSEDKCDNRERKNAQDIHPKKVDSVARVDLGLNERKKMTMKKNKSSSARTQAHLYFRFLTELVVAHVIILFTIVYVYIDGYSLLAYEVDFFLDKLFLDFYMHQRILRQVNMQMYTS